MGTNTVGPTTAGARAAGAPGDPAAWESPRRALSALYADAFTGFTAAGGGRPFARHDLEITYLDSDWLESRGMRFTSFFVSSDGRLAVVVGTLGATVLGVDADTILLQYDYFGVDADERLAPLTVSMQTQDPTLEEAQQRAVRAAATVATWAAAYNDRRAGAFLSCYRPQATWTDFSSPAWRVLTMAELKTAVRSDFSSAEFRSRIEAPAAMPLDNPYFVSYDGRFAAALGTYEDAATGTLPMLMVLEMDKGEIGQQYNFITIERELLDGS